MSSVIIDVLNPDATESTQKKTAKTQEEKIPERPRRFLRQQVININGQVVEAP